MKITGTLVLSITAETTNGTVTVESNLAEYQSGTTSTIQTDMIPNLYNSSVSTLDLRDAKDEEIQRLTHINAKLVQRIGQLTGQKNHHSQRADRWKEKYRQCDKKLSFDEDEDEVGVLYGGLHDQQ
jgi:hypothetical protein